MAVAEAPGETREAWLVLYAHGSNDPRWRAPFERLAASLGDRVRLAYMESSPPALDEVAAEAAAAGVGLLVVLPLFLASGVHVRRDVEQRAAAAREAHPGLVVEILEPVGEHPLLAGALEQIASEAIARLPRSPSQG